jgi:hypothetical protein
MTDRSPLTKLSERPLFSRALFFIGAFSGRAYAIWVTKRGFSPRYMLVCTILFGVMAVGLWWAAEKIAAVYFADKLLSQGTHIVGEVAQFDVERWRAHYNTVVTYTFSGPDGRRYTNTVRRPLAARPNLERGGPIDILYEPGNPDNNTMSKGLEAHLAEMPFAAWMFLLLGFYPALYVYRYIRWRQQAREEITPTHNN